MGDLPHVEMTVKVPAGDLLLEQAYRYVDDPSFWDVTMPDILASYPQLTVADYWKLTVTEHRFLYEATNANS